MRGRRIRVPLAVLTALVAAAPALARAPVVVDQQGRLVRGKLHAWIMRAKVPLPTGRIQVRRIPCPGNVALAACVYTARPRIVYMRPSVQGERRVFYHELGHVFDLTVLNMRDRARFKRIVGIRRSGWFHGALPPAEWFGDGYALCALHRRIRGSPPRTAYGYAPSPRAHARVCRLIRSAAKPHGGRPKRPKNPPPVVEVQPPPPGQTRSGGCTLVDQLVSDCQPPATQAGPQPPSQPGPPPPVPLPGG
jgi:hypothetical protein